MHEPMPEAEDEHRQGHLPVRRVDVEPRQQVQAERHHRSADDREDLVAPGPADDRARDDRRDQQAERPAAGSAGPTRWPTTPLTYCR